MRSCPTNFEKIKEENVHAIALEPVRTGQDIKNLLSTAGGENGPSWSLWQEVASGLKNDPWGCGVRDIRLTMP